MLLTDLKFASLFLIQADILVESHFLREMQQKMMENALVSSSNIQAGWWQYASMSHTTREDFCTWRGVECVDGFVNTFCLTWSVKVTRFFCDIRFLPQTLRFLHIKLVLIQSFSLRDLPRDAQSVFIETARVVGSEIHKVDVIDLADLPQGLEEGHIVVRPMFWGTVRIASVPEALRYFFLSTTSIKRVAVLNAGLSHSIQKINILRSSLARRPSILCMDDKKIDDRIKIMKNGSDPDIQWENYANYARTRALCDQMIREVMQQAEG